MPGIDYDCAGCGHRHEGADGTVANPWPLIEFTRPEVYLRMDPWEQLTRTRSTDPVEATDTIRGRYSVPSTRMARPVATMAGCHAHR